jgi:hypothetical protein
MQRPPPSKARGVPPAFLSDSSTLVLSATRDTDGERVVLLSWHQVADARGNYWRGQMELTEEDVRKLRDFCSDWLDLVPPPEPREAA